MLLPRIFLCAVLIFPCAAQAQFSLVATQLGYKDEETGASYAGICSRDACRATIPIRIFGIRCVLNIRVSAPTKAGFGSVLFASGPCERGYRIDLANGNSRSDRYELDSFGAMSKAYDLPFGPSSNPSFGNGTDDGVVHPSVRVRLELIATQERERR